MAMYSIGPTNCSCVVNKRLVCLVCKKRSISAGTHSYARQLYPSRVLWRFGTFTSLAMNKRMITKAACSSHVRTAWEAKTFRMESLRWKRVLMWRVLRVEESQRCSQPSSALFSGTIHVRSPCFSGHPMQISKRFTASWTSWVAHSTFKKPLPENTGAKKACGPPCNVANS